MEPIKKEARGIQKQLVKWRRYLHQHPETGAEVPETAAFVARRLRAMGLEVRTGVGGHGVVATLRGKKPGKTLAIRSDMDGLLVREETGLAFASKNEGRMHACGHDAHMAMTLGAAQVLSRHRGELSGNVKFLFQPAEEGPGGAKPMIRDGALKNPKVDAVIGMHIGSVWTEAKIGQVYVSHGPMLAAMDRIDVKIKGKGGHGAVPHRAVDPVSMACQVVTALQTIVSREVNPVEPAVVTIGKIAGGSAYNVIPGEVALEGTVRVLKQELREFLNRRIEGIIRGVTAAMRGEYEYRYTYGYPPVTNDARFTEEFAEVAREIVGPRNVKEIPEPSMCGEDMAYFLNAAPGTYFFLAGCNRRKGQVHPHHHSRFDVDEEVFWKGTALLSAMALRWLGGRKG